MTTAGQVAHVLHEIAEMPLAAREVLAECVLVAASAPQDATYTQVAARIEDRLAIIASGQPALVMA